MSTKVFRLQNQELIHFDQVVKGQAVVLTNKDNVKYKQKSIIPQEDGLYHNRVHQLVDDNVNMSEYSCSPTCMHLVGRVWEGRICPQCGCTVGNNYTVNLDRNSWISLGKHRVLTPIAYAMVRDIIGDTNLNKIIDFNDNIDLNGNLIIGEEVIDKRNPFNGIGMIMFYRKFEDIMRFYGKQKKKMDIAEFLIKYKNRIWTSKINVLSQELRPAFINSAEKTFRYDSINHCYMVCINNASLIAKAELTNQIMNINKYLTTIQLELFKLYDLIVQKLDGKNKLFRRQIQGTRMSWSSRMIITANTGKTYGLDQIVISYKAFLELYIFEIINVLKRGYINPKYMDVTMYEIMEWIDVERYSNKVHPDIYATMRWLIDNHEDGLWLLVNRQPTMDFASIQMLRIVDIIPNAIENHMKVPLTSLKGWNGDFDGDTLSVYSLKDRQTVEAFVGSFNPKHLIVNKVSGYKIFNTTFALPSDMLMSLYSFTDEECNDFADNKYTQGA